MTVTSKAIDAMIVFFNIHVILFDFTLNVHDGKVTSREIGKI